MTTSNEWQLTRELLEKRLRSAFGVIELEHPRGRAAAVAIVVATIGGGQGFFLIQRTSHLSAHPGQYALPGGRVDEGERVEETARRELEEELGISLSREHVVGRLPYYSTSSGFKIAPVVLWAEDLQGVAPNPAEVTEAYHIPLSALVGPGIPTLLWNEGAGKPIIQIPLGGERVIHAPTGAIIYQFARAALAGTYIDAQAFSEPIWARR